MLEVKGLQVMSFSVRGSFRDRETPEAWEVRSSPSVETIGRNAPDVIGFQEPQSGDLETYAERLPLYDGVLGPEYGSQARPSLNAIFFYPRRLSLLASGGFWPSETPERYSSSWCSRVVRSANWTCFESSITGLSFLHLNTHLDHASSSARREGSP